MESKPEDAAGTASAPARKELLQENSSGEGAASALSRLRTIEKAQADTGLTGRSEQLDNEDPA